MLQDARASYPMTCGATFRFEGRFDRQRLEEATRETLDRHPMFRALISYPWGRRARWIAADRYPELRWVEDAEVEAFEQSTPIDLRHEPGLRIWVKERGDQSELLFEFHHGCADGAGGLLFIEDLLTLYASKFDGHRTLPLPPPQFHRLLNRGRFDGASGWSWERLRAQMSILPELKRFATRMPQPLQRSTQQPIGVVPAAPARRMSTHVLDSEVVSLLRETAVQHGATLNDLLISALFITVQRWNARRKQVRPNDWLRILMPANLRNRADLDTPASNRMSYAFLTQRVRDVCDLPTAMRAVAAETNRVRRLRLPMAFLSQLGLLDATRFGLPLMLSERRCFATAVLSNVGDPTRRFRSRLPRENGLVVVGNVRLTGMQGITALRPLTRAAVFVNTYADQITINTRLDPTCFAPAETERFSDSFLEHLGASKTCRPVSRAA